MKVRIATAILSTGLAIAPMLIAQNVPDITLPAGDAARGKTVFESIKGNCQSCHRVNGTGSLYGPDLSAVGAPPRAAGPTGGRGGQAPATPPAGPTPQQLAQSI